jgi:hypothetical protein
MPKVIMLSVVAPRDKHPSLFSDNVSHEERKVCIFTTRIYADT